ncbi:MAG: HAD-IIB family hydrolase [Polyangiaceae bacterium]|nr:HAD-IIB family hydrolase [Polyangiaceae bacterium]
MRPLTELTQAEAAGLDGLLFDLDDTLLDHGKLTEGAYASLFRLRESGLRLLAVTGRPAGWGEVIARQWPVDAAVTENGAVTLYASDGLVRRHDSVPEDERRRRRIRLAEAVAKINEAHPELRAADDVGARHSDFAYDIGEHQRVAPEVVRAVCALAHEHGARTHTSSVHLHLTFDGDDKASGVVRTVRLLWGTDPTLIRFRYAFIGDSENDAACFAAFRTTIGVENLSGRPTVGPRFITHAARGRGFAEAAAHLVALRSG